MNSCRNCSVLQGKYDEADAVYLRMIKMLENFRGGDFSHLVGTLCRRASSLREQVSVERLVLPRLGGMTIGFDWRGVLMVTLDVRAGLAGEIREGLKRTSASH